MHLCINAKATHQYRSCDNVARMSMLDAGLRQLLEARPNVAVAVVVAVLFYSTSMF